MLSEGNHTVKVPFLIMLLAFCPAIILYAQPVTGRGFSNELDITSVNDNFLPPFRDRYFTNGLSISFSHVLHSDLLWGKLIPGEYKKSIIRLKISQEIYTPKNIVEGDVLEFDRPYAGYLFLEAALHTFWERKNSLQLAINTGVIGSKAAGRQVQTWWHRLINYPRPKGWQYQIKNEPVINFGLVYKHSWLFSSHFDFIPALKMQAGTAFNNLSAGGTLRAGNINPIDCSAIAGSRVGGACRAQRPYRDEWFFFLGTDNTLVLRNTLIEGGVLHPTEGKYTKKAEPYFMHLKAGVAYSTPTITWMLVIHRLTPEVVGGEPHNYASINLAFRF